MILEKLHVVNFRSYSEREVSFSPGTTLVIGPNTAGKTNLLEAVYLLSSGRSLSASVESDLIHLGADWARVGGVLLADGRDNRLADAGLGVDLSVADEGGKNDAMELEVFIARGENGRSTKQFKVNGVKKGLGAFQGVFRVVVFSPEYLRLVSGSPSRRRRYLDRVLSSLDPFYFRALDEYKKVLRNRNQLLWEIRERGAARRNLEFWDDKLFALGEEILAKRTGLFSDLGSRLATLGLGLELSYRPSVLERVFYGERLPAEIARATTLWGPHRDDFLFLRAGEERNLATFGSRGEQREAVFALCLAELDVVTNRVGERPALLLDDIFSELDEAHRQKVLEVLPKQQAIITSAEPELLNSELMGSAGVIQLD